MKAAEERERREGDGGVVRHVAHEGGEQVHPVARRRRREQNLRRAGVDEGTIMKLCGWDTRAMFDRYNIIDERDLRAGVQKLAGVTSESHSGSSAESTRT